MDVSGQHHAQTDILLGRDPISTEGGGWVGPIAREERNLSPLKEFEHLIFWSID
jgi:hypothetical protein